MRFRWGRRRRSGSCDGWGMLSEITRERGLAGQCSCGCKMGHVRLVTIAMIEVWSRAIWSLATGNLATWSRSTTWSLWMSEIRVRSFDDESTSLIVRWAKALCRGLCRGHDLCLGTLGPCPILGSLVDSFQCPDNGCGMCKRTCCYQGPSIHRSDLWVASREKSVCG